MATFIKDLQDAEPNMDERLAKSLRAAEALGYETVEQFVGAARAAKGAFESYLQTDLTEVLRSLPAPDALPADIASTEYGLGVELSSLPRIAPAPNVIFSAERFRETALREEVDLTPQMPPVRDQNPRGACVAHAALSVFEHVLGKSGSQFDMSEQFLIFLCKENDGQPHLEGSTLGTAFGMLRLDGCCLEQTWRYNNHSTPCNWGQGPPPPEASPEAAGFRINGIDQIAPRRVADIKTVLASERCVAFSIPAFRSWFCNDEVKLSGKIIMPPPGDLPMGGHSMCMVGYRDMPLRPDLGGGEFLIRNSWGERWGINSDVKGYGTVSYRFIESFGLEAFSISP